MEHGGKEVLSYPLSSPAALEPSGEWDRLRRECPVAHITFPSGDSGSLLTRYDDVKQVLPQISKWFTVRRMNELRTTVEGMAESLVDDMAAKGSPADLKSNFGFPPPVGGLTEVPVRW